MSKSCHRKFAKEPNKRISERTSSSYAYRDDEERKFHRKAKDNESASRINQTCLEKG